MKSRDTLIKLHRFRADEAQRNLAGLEAMRAELEGKIAELDRLLGEEQRRAMESEMGRFAYPTFAKSVAGRKENVRRSIAEIDRQIENARDLVEAAFRELKKYEIADERIRAAQAGEAARLAQAEADETALGRFVRAQG